MIINGFLRSGLSVRIFSLTLHKEFLEIFGLNFDENFLKDLTLIFLQH